jgi:hypothetical protein
MATQQQAQRAYDNQTDTVGDWYTAQSEAASVRLSELERDPAAIEQALELIDCDHAGALMPLRVQAHLTGDWSAFRQHESTLLASYLTKRAKDEIADEFGERRGSTGNLFGARLARQAVLS